jgi:hypothetical protein
MNNLNYPLYKNPVIEKANNSSFGNWKIKVNDVTFHFFWKKSQAKDFLKKHLNNI